MKCDNCKRIIEPTEKFYTAIGVNLCEDCNAKSNSCVSIDMVLNKIKKQKEESLSDKLDHLAYRYIKDTTVDGQKFCGCRPEDCSDYHNNSKCKICLDKFLKEEKNEKERTKKQNKAEEN